MGHWWPHTAHCTAAGIVLVRTTTHTRCHTHLQAFARPLFPTRPLYARHHCFAHAHTALHTPRAPRDTHCCLSYHRAPHAHTLLAVGWERRERAGLTRWRQSWLVSTFVASPAIRAVRGAAFPRLPGLRPITSRACIYARASPAGLHLYFAGAAAFALYTPPSTNTHCHGCTRTAPHTHTPRAT